ncbi:hypothetical protein [Indiicoccus explosivorum]|uniref:hypothetical protein n=1 Tax=Indiicoccus explosivorum TaxID=1917864 RepID=UPI000B4358BB|nr:hypothetical protein [Indiicoccus explosivorum]
MNYISIETIVEEGEDVLKPKDPELAAFDRSLLMSDLRTELHLAAIEGKTSKLVTYERLGSPKTALKTYEAFTFHGFSVGAQDEGLLIEWR